MRGPARVIFPLAGRRVFVAGHRGMVGSALVRRLSREGCEFVAVPRGELDLRRQKETEDWMLSSRPEMVFIAAATVGGIQANKTRPAEFLYDNLAITANLIEAARRGAVRKLVFLGSSCTYPREAAQPIPEEALLTGPLEPTNEWYAIAKIAGLKLCAAYRRQWGCDFIAVQPNNLYGPGDDFDLETSHVVSALIAKLHDATVNGTSEVEIWGTGTPRREFMHVDDAADAIVFLAERYSEELPLNIGSGSDVSIAELAVLIADIVGFTGRFRYATDKPDGMPRKLFDIGRMTELGWRPRIALRDGLADSYRWYLEHIAR